MTEEVVFDCPAPFLFLKIGTYPAVDYDMIAVLNVNNSITIYFTYLLVNMCNTLRSAKTISFCSQRNSPFRGIE